MTMFPPDKILFPSDLSDVSKAAGEHARELARAFSARIQAVFVDQGQLDEGWMPGGAALSPRARERVLETLREQAGAAAEAEIVEGEPAAAIVRLAKARRPDLVVMGSHFRPGLGRLFGHSIAEAVVRACPRPVWVAHGPPVPPRAVLAPVNLTRYSAAGLRYAARVAAALGAPLRALYVAETGTKRAPARRELSAMLAALPPGLARACRPTAEVFSGSPTELILEAGIAAGLIVLVAHRKTLLGDLILGTTAERVLRHSPAPVIAVPGPPR